MVTRTVIPVAMKKDGDGKQHFREQMMPDYACCEEPSYFYISSPLNVWSIGRSDSVVLYVEGGCPPFTWESDSEWATLDTAETNVRYNTLESSADAGGNIEVTVTDSCNEVVTISVPWNGALSCCEDPPEFSIQTVSTEVVANAIEHVIFLDGGCPAFTWTISGGSGWTLDYAATNSRRNRAVGALTSTGLVLDVEDSCGQTDCISLPELIAPCGFKVEGETKALIASGYKPPITYEFIGSHVGWTLNDDEVTVSAEPTDKCVTVQLADACESETTAMLFVDDVEQVDITFAYPSVVSARGGNVVVVSYQGTSNYGYSKSYTLDNCMQLTAVNSLTHKDAYSTYHHQCSLWDGTVVCTAYRLQGPADFAMSSLYVAADGTISQPDNSYLMYEDGASSTGLQSLFPRDPSSGGVVVAVYTHSIGYIRATTMEVAETGSITDPVISQMMLNASLSQDPSAVMITNDSFFAAWRHVDNYIHGAVISVSAVGALAILTADTEIRAAVRVEHHVLKLDDNWVIILCRDSNYVGYIVTVEISDAGTITIPTGTEYAFAAAEKAHRPRGVVLGNGYVAIAAHDNDNYLHYWLFKATYGENEISWEEVETDIYDAVFYNLWDMTECSDAVVFGYHDATPSPWIRTRGIC